MWDMPRETLMTSATEMISREEMNELIMVEIIEVMKNWQKQRKEIENNSEH